MKRTLWYAIAIGTVILFPLAIDAGVLARLIRNWAAGGTKSAPSGGHRCIDGGYSIETPEGFECNRVPGEADLCIGPILEPDRFVEVYGQKPLPTFKQKESKWKYIEEKLQHMEVRFDESSLHKRSHTFIWRELGRNYLYSDQPVLSRGQKTTVGLLVASDRYCLVRIVEPARQLVGLDEQFQQVLASVHLDGKGAIAPQKP